MNINDVEQLVKFLETSIRIKQQIREEYKHMMKCSYSGFDSVFHHTSGSIASLELLLEKIQFMTGSPLPEIEELDEE